MMNTKKTIRMAAMLAMTALLFTSCINERVTNYRMSFSPDLIETCDVTVIYRGENGIEMTESVTDTLWEKSFHNDTLPLIFGLDYRIQPKQGVKPEKEQLDLQAKYYFELKRDKLILFSSSSDSLISMQVPASQLDSVVQEAAKHHAGPFYFTAKKDGVWDME